jgi:hypothetical protein
MVTLQFRPLNIDMNETGGAIPKFSMTSGCVVEEGSEPAAMRRSTTARRGMLPTVREVV